MAVDTLVYSAFGTVVRTLFQGLFPAPSWHTLPALACGGALAGARHTMTPSGWLTGAAAVKHCARCSVFRGCPRSPKRWQLWGAVIRLAAQGVPEGEVMRGSCAAPTKKKAGTPIEGLAHYRHGAGSARQAYRTLRGVHCVLGRMHRSRPRWPGHCRRVPVGCALSRTAPPAPQRNVPYRSRRQWARDLLDVLAPQWPGRALYALADGGYATKASRQQWPTAAHAVGRFPLRAKLDELPPPPPPKRRGAPRTKGDRLGSPKTLAQTATGWAPHPSAAGAAIQAGGGLWPPVLPGRLWRGVGVRRQAHSRPPRAGQRHPPRRSRHVSRPRSPCAPRPSSPPIAPAGRCQVPSVTPTPARGGAKSSVATGNASVGRTRGV
jgi:hypothetical protein